MFVTLGRHRRIEPERRRRCVCVCVCACVCACVRARACASTGVRDVFEIYDTNISPRQILIIKKKNYPRFHTNQTH